MPSHSSTIESENNHNDDNNNASTTNDEHHILWYDFMNRVGLDVFQFILSFLPPIPYLFQLQRVSSHWHELCKECMKEDCTELYWDQNSSIAILKMLKFDFSQYRSNLHLPTAYTDLSIGGMDSNYEMIGFLRKILLSFKKLKCLTFRNMELDASVLYLIFVEWCGGMHVENIKFVECSINFQCLPRKIIYENNGIISIGIGIANFTLPQLIETRFEYFDQNNRVIKTSINALLKNMKECKLKVVNFFSCHSLTENYYTNNIVLPIDLLSIISSFGNLESAFFNCPSQQGIDCVTLCKKIIPSVKFSVPCYEVASKMLVYSTFEEVVEYYVTYLSKNFSLRRNRLNAYQRRKIQTKQDFDQFHNHVIPTLVNFFQVYSPFGFDTDLKDIQGYNILQIAISGGMSLMVDFLLDYFVIYNQEINNMEEVTIILNKLFASNNRLDGRNSTFLAITKEKHSIIERMMEYRVHFNAPDSEGSTIAHYCSQFGQLSKLKSLVAKLDVLPTVEERKYFLDFNARNDKGETPVSICYQYKMFGLLGYLAEIAPRYDIQNIPIDVPAEIILTPEDFKRAFVHKKKDQPGSSNEEPKRKCLVQ